MYDVTYVHSLVGCMMWLIPIHFWNAWWDLWPSTDGMHDVTYSHPLLGCMMWPMSNNCLDLRCDLYPFHASSWVVYVTHAHPLLGCMMWLMPTHCWDAFFFFFRPSTQNHIIPVLPLLPLNLTWECDQPQTNFWLWSSWVDHRCQSKLFASETVIMVTTTMTTHHTRCLMSAEHETA